MEKTSAEYKCGFIDGILWVLKNRELIEEDFKIVVELEI